MHAHSHKLIVSLAKTTFAIFVSSSLFACGDADELKPRPSAQPWTLPVTGMPLGPAALTQTVSSRSIAPGVTYYQIARGETGPADFWTANVGFYPTQSAAQNDAAALVAAGFLTRFDASAGTGLGGATLGYYLSVGHYGTKAEATASTADIARATSDRYRPAVRNTALGGGSATGPWLVNLLAIRPAQTTAKLTMALPEGNNLGGDGETVSAAVARLHAVAGMNGGFFSNINPSGAPLPPRSPVGTTVVDGKLIGTAVGGRPGIMIKKAADGRMTATVLSALTTRVTVSDMQGAAIDIKAINRPILGTVVNCGTPAEAPTVLPAQDYVCTNYNDLVRYDGLYLRGKASNTLVDASYRGATYELLVDASGTVVDGHPTPGSPAPVGGYVLQGLGRNAAWLQNHSARGTRLLSTSHVYSAGAEVALAPDTTIVEAGPTLSASNLAAQAALEGFSPAVDAIDVGDSSGTPAQSWYEGWYVNRNGRTTVGVAADGTILLVEIDGRQPGLSLGTSIPETAAVMHWLGALTSLNLDGGGSSNMVVDGTTIGHPSDSTGERGVAGTLLITAKERQM